MSNSMQHTHHRNTSGATGHTTWCDGKHGDLQERCFTRPVEIGRLSVWLAGEAGQGPEVVIDSPPAGTVVTPAQAKTLAAALLDLAAIADKAALK